MSEQTTNGTTGYRLAAAERRLDRLESFEPAVVRRDLTDVREDLHEIAKDFGSLRKLFMGFVITFCLTSISIVVLILTNLAHGKP